MVRTIVLRDIPAAEQLDFGGDAGRQEKRKMFDVPFDGSFTRPFMEAPELRAIGRDLIGKWPELFDLDGVDIVYLWQRKGSTSHGRVILGKCQKLGGLSAYFSEQTYAILIAADHCRYSLTAEQMEALVYHELLHIDVQEDEKTGDPIYGLKGHNVEMFYDEVNRYGMWKRDLKGAAECFHQRVLFEEQPQDDAR